MTTQATPAAPARQLGGVDNLFADCCYGTETQHAKTEPCPVTLAYAMRLLSGEQPPANTNVGTRHEWLRAAQEAVDGDASDLDWMICADNAPYRSEAL